MVTNKTYPWVTIYTAGVAIEKRAMDSKLESLGINGSTDELAEYINRFNFWIDTTGTSDEEAIEGAFLTAVRREAATLLRTLVYPINLKGSLNRRTSRSISAKRQASPFLTG